MENGLICAWAMLAVSSDAQSETLPHQRRMAEQTALQQGWTIDRFLGEGREGVGSGKAGPRAIVVHLIAELSSLAPEQRPAWVWMRRVDRTGRGRATESMLALYTIHDLGVRIWDQDTGEVRLDTAEGELPALLKTWFGRIEGEMRASKARAGNARRRAAGLPIGNRRPYGLTNGPTGDVVVEDQAEAVRMAFRMRLDGAGYDLIARQMVAVAPPQQFRRRPSTRAIAWSPMAVRRLLGTEAYVPLIVDEFTFRRAQQIREQRTNLYPSRARIYPWPLAGALRCFCGAALVGFSTSVDVKRGKVYRYYACTKLAQHGGRKLMHPAAFIEEQFRALLIDLNTDPSLIAEYRRQNVAPTSPVLLRERLKSVKAELQAIDARRARVWKMNETGLVKDADVQVHLDELTAEREALQPQVSMLEVQIVSAGISERQVADAAATIRRAAATFADAADADQRLIAQAVGGALGGLWVDGEHRLNAARPTRLAK